MEQPYDMERNLKELLVEKYGIQFAERAMKHLYFVAQYTDYGAPGHMDYVLINALASLIENLNIRTTE